MLRPKKVAPKMHRGVIPTIEYSYSMFLFVQVTFIYLSN